MLIVDSRAPSFRPAHRPSSLLQLVLLTLAWAASSSTATAQVGHEFWLAWPETGDATGEDPNYDVGAQLVLLAPSGSVRIRVTGPGLDLTVTARPGSPALVELDRFAQQVTELDRAVAKGLHLTAESCEPFGALLRVPGSGASVADDVARLIPTAMLGRRYYPVSALGMAEFVVVATENNTLVTIDDPTCSSPPPVVLDQGEAFLHRCEGGPDGGDVTGTIVEASAPVAVLSGSVSSRVLSVRDNGNTEVFWDFADVLLEANWPADLLGRTHVHVPFRKTSPDAVGDAVRLVAACAGSRTWVEPEEGGSWLFDVSAEAEQGYLGPSGPDPRGAIMPGAAVMTGTRPIQVAAYTTGISNAGIGDPSLTLLDPEKRWEREAIAWLPAGYDHSIGLAIRRGAEGSVRIDGSAPAGVWRAASPSASHLWLRLDNVSAGEHRISASEPISVQVSGFTSGGQPGAYSYPAVSLRSDGLAEFRVESDAPLCVSACAGSCFQLEVPAGFTEADWSNGDSGLEITVCPNGAETIAVSALDARGCRHEATVEVAAGSGSAPPAIEGPDTTCAGECVELIAPANQVAYDWSTGGDERIELVCEDASASIEVVITDRRGCSLTLTHELTVLDAPLLGAATIAAPDPCLAVLTVDWEPAVWPAGTPPGVYHLFRREGSCAPADDPSWELIASNLTATSWTDRSAEPGIDWSYRLTAEADDAPSGCRPGPAFGGSTNTACASPEAQRAPAPLPTPEGLSPWLRVGGVERPSLGAAAEAVTLSWAGARSGAADDRLEVLKGDRPELLLARPAALSGTRWRDANAGEAGLLFYRVRRVGPCGDHSD